MLALRSSLHLAGGLLPHEQPEHHQAQEAKDAQDRDQAAHPPRPRTLPVQGPPRSADGSGSENRTPKAAVSPTAHSSHVVHLLVSFASEDMVPPRCEAGMKDMFHKCKIQSAKSRLASLGGKDGEKAV